MALNAHKVENNLLFGGRYCEHKKHTTCNNTAGIHLEASCLPITASYMEHFGKLFSFFI